MQLNFKTCDRNTFKRIEYVCVNINESSLDVFSFTGNVSTVKIGILQQKNTNITTNEAINAFFESNNFLRHNLTATVKYLSIVKQTLKTKILSIHLVILKFK